MVTTQNGHHNGDDSPLSLADKCGCIPLAATPLTDLGPVSPDAAASAADDLQEVLPDAPESDSETATLQRALKLVVTLEPGENQGYRALLALGATGCDPLFRSVPAESLDAALAAVPALLAEAETRWQSQPRYPAAAPTAAPRPRPATTPGSRSNPRATPHTAPTPSGQDAPEQPPAGEATQASTPATPRSSAQPSPAGQLSLFG